MNVKLAAFDETCLELRRQYGECLRRRALYERHTGALNAAWLKWCKQKNVGPEPLRTEDDDITSMLSAAVAVADRIYSNEVHQRLVPEHCQRMPVRDRQEALKWWQTRIMETLAPKLQSLVDRPMRVQFDTTYPECLEIIVFGDIEPTSMDNCGDLLDSISSGTLRFCANIVEDNGELIALCDAGQFDVAWEKSWLHCIATIRHENLARIVEPKDQ